MTEANSTPLPKMIVGDGGCALALVGSFLTSGSTPIVWLSGSRSRIFPPLAGMEEGPASEFLQTLLKSWSLEGGEVVAGNSLREYRNKAFKQPKFDQTQKNPHADLWLPERRWADCAQVRFGVTLAELEENLRKAIVERNSPLLRRLEGIPLNSIQKSESGIVVTLGSGERLECSELFYADRWSLLSGIEGLPKPLGFNRQRGPVGVLQAHFIHSVPVGLGVQESFMIPLYRDAGEDVDRHVWGYFHSSGLTSTWSCCLGSEEVEDNHSIAKKFRKIKSTLERAFAGSAVIPEGFTGFSSTLVEEQVRFEEEAVYSLGSIQKEPEHVSELPGVWFMTDGCGPASSLLQARSAAAEALNSLSTGS